MRHADMALYRAKNEGRNRACIYDSAMEATSSIASSWRTTCALRSKRINCTSLISRSSTTAAKKWSASRRSAAGRHPVRGEIPPSEFIPVAENSGLIIALGEKVLRRACLEGKEWPGIDVSVNVSPVQFRRAGLR